MEFGIRNEYKVRFARYEDDLDDTASVFRFLKSDDLRNAVKTKSIARKQSL